MLDSFVSTDWMNEHDSRLCPGCSKAVVALTGRCGQCKQHIPDSCYNVSAPRARNLPKLEQNHVVQISLGANEAVLRSGLPTRSSVPTRSRTKLKFEVERIIDRRRVDSIVKYLVVW